MSGAQVKFQSFFDEGLDNKLTTDVIYFRLNECTPGWSVFFQPANDKPEIFMARNIQDSGWF